MKKLVMLVFGVFAFYGVSYAEVVTTTPTAVAHHGSHVHNVDVPDAPEADERDTFGAGIGADVVVYRGDTPLLDEVTVETRYDIGREEVTVMGVVKVDLFSYLKNR